MLVRKLKCVVEKLDDFGRGIVKVGDKVCFVSNALPGEVIDVQLVQEKKKFLIGEVREFYEKSDKRIVPKCKYYDMCGGCNLGHMSFEEENNYKIEKVRNILKKFAGIDVKINDIFYGDQYYYRNKITLRVQEGKLGLLKESSHDFIEIDKCLLVLPKINEVISELKKILSFEDRVSKIMIRVSNDSKFVMIKVFGELNHVSEIENICDSLIINDKVVKNKYIESQILNKKFYVSSNSFFQVNKEVVEKLYEHVIEVIKKNNSKRVLDLYCGVGTIGICVSDYVSEVFGIEVVDEAIVSANENKFLNKANNINFKCGKVEDIIDEGINTFDTVIVDPPRSGIDKKAIGVLNDSNINTIVYVSCDPITLARDIKLLNNYNVKDVKIFNMFSRTYHCESVAVLERK